MGRLRLAVSFLTLFMLLASAGPSAWAHVPVSESDSEIPYEFLGAVEVNTKPGLLLNHVVGLLTIGLLAQKDAEVVKKQLKRLLAKRAKLYSPDAVVNVVYSPDPSDSRFLKEKTVYAKGDMVKYKKAYTY